MTETYIVCEGYHDRAFWAGALLHLGCTDPGERAHGIRVPVSDPWGTGVSGGQYAFHTQRGHFVRLVPAGGQAKVLSHAKERLEDRVQKELHRLVICVDADSPADGRAITNGGMNPTDLLHWVQGVDPDATLADGREVLLANEKSRVNLVCWRTASDDPGEGLPRKQTLERILCDAMNRAYAERARPVETWLASRPDPPPNDPKEYALSRVAGWFAKSGGYEAAIRAWWARPDVCSHLEAVLLEAGIWPVMQAISNTADV